jgi:hypothetical protein
VRSSDNNDFARFLLGQDFHLFDESLFFQEVIRGYHTVILFHLFREPIKELRMDYLLATIGKNYRPGPKIEDLFFLANIEIKTVSNWDKPRLWPLKVLNREMSLLNFGHNVSILHQLNM